jgi:hypothetical protein
MTLGKWAAPVGAAGAFLLAGYSAVTESMPQLHIFDGYRMIFGAALAVGAVAPIVWRWRRERSLVVVVAACILGCWLPIVWLAVRRHTPVMQRIYGAWYLVGGDVVGSAIPVGVACLWLTIRRAAPARDA